MLNRLTNLPLTATAFERSVSVLHATETLAAIKKAGEVYGLPTPIATALEAVDIATDLVGATKATRTAENARVTAAEGLAASALAGTPVDVSKAVRGIVSAQKLDLESGIAVEVVAVAQVAAMTAAAKTIADHAIDFLVNHVRPVAMSAYAGIADTVAELPVATQPDRPLAGGAVTAGKLAVLQAHVETVEAAYKIRALLQKENLLAAPEHDTGSKFNIVRDFERFEDSRLLSGDVWSRLAGQVVESALPDPASLNWWITLARGWATFWFPTPTEVDQVVTQYFADVKADRVLGAYGTNPQREKFTRHTSTAHAYT